MFIPGLARYSLSRTLFPWPMKKPKKRVQAGPTPRRGSLQRLANGGFRHSRGAEICPLSAITCPFFPLPKMCPGEGVISPSNLKYKHALLSGKSAKGHTTIQLQTIP
jgi:hypothetical protein